MPFQYCLGLVSSLSNRTLTRLTPELSSTAVPEIVITAGEISVVGEVVSADGALGSLSPASVNIVARKSWSRYTNFAAGNPAQEHGAS